MWPAAPRWSPTTSWLPCRPSRSAGGTRRDRIEPLPAGHPLWSLANCLITRISQTRRSPSATGVVSPSRIGPPTSTWPRARVVAPDLSPLPAARMHWRGRLSEISGWSFGHLGAEPPTAPAQDADHYM
jgi:hypothetical protein